ncbi:hypothetical protein [Sporomusa sphaeroides]|uniref:hypothetical protein n=1 Tax=Sporomusa sphaeroides TaxID=47679 RepID=UPI002B6E0463|nr:hypothetical protein [Sporomusa sphaeroides]HML34197.1 hypothetical protein [Sporomusa sphaeroides]
MNTHRFRWITPASCLCLTVFLASIGLGWLLPAEYGNENGPIEWLQVVVLGVAALVSISALFQTGLSPSPPPVICLDQHPLAAKHRP